MSRIRRSAGLVGLAATILALAAVPSQAEPVPDDPTAPAAIQDTSSPTMTIAPVATPTETVPAPAAPAGPPQVLPNSGEGIISMVTRTCGSSGNWQGIAAANSITPPFYIVRLGVAYTIDCSTSPDPAPSPPPVAPAPAAPVVSGGSVAGLSAVQSNNARIIVQQGLSMGLGRQALVIAIATAMQESSLHNYANPYYPSSYNYTDEGEGYDHDSLGLFQQRPSCGWGSVDQVMNPWYAAGAFYNALMRFDYWDYSVTGAAQKVQGSAYPGAYAKWEGLAWSVVDALV